MAAVLVIDESSGLVHDGGSPRDKQVVLTSDGGSPRDKRVIGTSDGGSPRDKRVVRTSDDGIDAQHDPAKYKTIYDEMRTLLRR